YTGEDGYFQTVVPAAIGEDDYIAFLPVGVQNNGTGDVSFIVADPNLTPSSTPYSVQKGVGEDPELWLWGWPLWSVDSGQDFVVTEDEGSGAARVFDYLRYAYYTSETRWPDSSRKPLIVWLGMGVSWDCGSCYAPAPHTAFGTTFGGQIWIDGDSDENYWADAVIAHELGHWSMIEFGRFPGEAGAHCAGVKTFPGQAWSEGWASWFSADVRREPLFVSKYDGTMFWFDISSREYYGEVPWQRASAYDPDGLLQKMDENEVAAMLWNMSWEQGIGREPLDRALASDRMTVPPFARGYATHRWQVGSECKAYDVADTGLSAPVLPDFLDALVCGGQDSSVIAEATEPYSYYPYTGRDPLCR
ncbi:MAG: hypothetical protein V2A73_21200, partial [Pseudomonadota bacterium]